MATNTIIVEYKVELDGLKTQMKSLEDSMKKAENQAKQTAENTTKHFEKASSGIKEAGKEILAALGIAFGVEKVVEFGKESVKAFVEAEANANKLKFAVTKISGETETAFRKLMEQSEKMQKSTVFSDDSVQQAQTMLLTLGLNSKQVEELTPKIADLASATGQDLAGATQQVIQGINGQTRGLKAVGISFDATTDKTKNLSLITEKLTKFQGASGEALLTTAGKAKRFDNALDDIKENVGQFIVGQGNLLLDFFDSLSEGFDTVAQRTAKGILAESFKKQNDKIIEEAQKSESERVRLVKESDAKIVEISKNGLKEQDLNKKNFLLVQLKNEQQLNAELKKLNQERNNLGADPAIGEAAKKAAADAKKTLQENAEAGAAAWQALSDEIDQISADMWTQVGKDQRDAEKELEKNAKDGAEAWQQMSDEIDGISKKSKEQRIKDEEDRSKAVLQIEKDTASAVISIVSSIGTISKNVSDAKIQASEDAKNEAIKNLDYELSQKEITQKQYDVKKAAIEEDARKKQSDLKKKEWEREKSFALAQAAIKLALGIASALEGDPYTVLARVAIAAGIGAAEIAAIASAPTPQFEKGGKVGGKRHSAGGTVIEAEKDEWIIKRDEAIKHDKLLSAINKGQAEGYIYNQFVAPALRMQMKKVAEQKERSFASNLANSMMFNFKDENLLDSLKQSRRSDKENILYLAKIIEKKRNNIRDVA